MAEVHIRKRTYRNGKVSYEYYFEAASVNGERKRISQSGFTTKTEAQIAGQKALNDYEHTGMTITKVSDISYADFLSQWINEDVSHTCKEITVENYKKGRPPKKPTRTEPHVYITQDRINEIFNRFPEGTPNHVALMLGYHCGLRLGETFGLVWEDVDFENKLLKINRQVQWKSDNSRTKNDKLENNGSNAAGNGFWYLSEPKYQSYRIINLDDEILALLQREKAKREKAEPYYDEHFARYYVEHPLQFTGNEPSTQPPQNKISSAGPIEIHLINSREDGSYITARTMQHTSSIIHHNLAFPEFDYHSLRHTHATMLSEQGAPLQYIQKRLDHKKEKVTTEVYTNHLTDAIKQQGNNILNAMF